MFRKLFKPVANLLPVFFMVRIRFHMQIGDDPELEITDKQACLHKYLKSGKLLTDAIEIYVQ